MRKPKMRKPKQQNQFVTVADLVRDCLRRHLDLNRVELRTSDVLPVTVAVLTVTGGEDFDGFITLAVDAGIQL